MLAHKISVCIGEGADEAVTDTSMAMFCYIDVECEEHPPGCRAEDERGVIGWWHTDG